MRIFFGLFLVAAGLAAIGFAASQVAGTTSVAAQVPFVIGGGLGGLAVVVAGAVLVDVSVRLQGARESREELGQLTVALTEVRRLLESDVEGRRSAAAEPGDEGGA